MNRLFTGTLAFVTALALSGCALPGPSGPNTPRTEDMSVDQMAQTDFNRTVTVAMRDNLDSLNRLLEKLYRRNPAEWRKSGAGDIETAIKRGQAAIESGQAPAPLRGLADIQILSVSLDPSYTGDRVAAFVFGLADTIVRAHNGKTRFYVTDALEAQKVYNAARNVEIAAWMLSTRKNSLGQPLLLANEITPETSNLSFEREFGQLVGRLDLIANLLDENLRRVGINYVQGLLFFNFLPVR
ncbi:MULTISPECIES: hypothetical protein [unclassified Pusillimonas]|uniref:hypothetical protein n=1 Tax=unclassified Pusillimonas TaxID=2640016 RepID=UPI000B9D289A|nr:MULTISPECIES: hypothetical protein [unclassified Pusillimonas]OXR50523.1 hypothetical protein PuT2_01230 [Pusillimonas sp. T2]ROT45556.1 hypothetical protein CHR62_07365 [Pusillimonas sp. NJUB218]